MHGHRPSTPAGALALAGALTVLAALVATAAPRAPAAPLRPAAALTVTSTNDVDDGTCSAYPGHCSLREAINAANANPGADTVAFHPTVSGVILLATVLPHFTDGVTVLGPGAAVLTVYANNLGSVLWVNPGVAATIQGLTLTRGVGSGAGGTSGGGLVNEGNTTLDAMLIQGNSASNGGGVFNAPGADLVVTNSTFAANVASSFGGAIYNVSGGTNVTVAGSTFAGNTSGTGALNAPAGTTLAITNSTISGNFVTQPGGVGGVLGGTNVQIAFSTIVSNQGIGLFSSWLRSSIVDSCGTSGGIVGSQGHNLAVSAACFFNPQPSDVFNATFLLGPLQNNGGPTDTHELLTGSPAIDTGDPNACPSTDQRSYPRPVGAACDIGAYEFRSQPPPTATPTRTPTPGCVIAPAGMVAWYPLNEPPGATSVTDVWAAHNGTPLPGPIGGVMGPTFGPVPGPVAPSVVPPFKVVGALYFWDEQRLANVPHHPALDIATTGSFSIDAWIYTATHVPGGSADFISPIVDKFDTSASLGYGLYVRHDTLGNDILSFVYGDGTTVTNVAANPGLPQLAWVHVAATVERLSSLALDIRLYVNGTQQGSLLAPPPGAPIASTQTLHIGGMRLVPTVVGLVGYTEIGMDELELFNRALTAAEVHALFAVGSYGKCRPPVDVTATPTRTKVPHWPVYVVAVIKGPLGGHLPPGPSATPRPSATPTLTGTAVPTTSGTPSPTPTVPLPTDTPSLTPTITQTPRLTFTPSATATDTPSVTPSGTPTPTATATATATASATNTPGLACAPQPANMVAWWALDEIDDPLVWDSVGGHHGTPKGGTIPLDLAVVAAGRTFDGTSGQVVVPGSPDLDPGTSDFSVDAWVRPQSDAWLPLVTKVSAPADAPLGFALFVDAGRLGLALTNDATGAAGTAPNPMTLFEWHHVAATVVRASPTGGKLYLDGMLIHTFDVSTLAGPVESSGDLLLGAIPALGRGQPERYLAGSLDEVEEFHRALTPEEVGALYAAGSAGKCAKPMRPTATQVPVRPARRTPLDAAGRMPAYSLTLAQRSPIPE